MKRLVLSMTLAFALFGGVVADSITHPAKAIPTGSVGKRMMD